MLSAVCVGDEYALELDGVSITFVVGGGDGSSHAMEIAQAENPCSMHMHVPSSAAESAAPSLECFHGNITSTPTKTIDCYLFCIIGSLSR